MSSIYKFCWLTCVCDTFLSCLVLSNNTLCLVLPCHVLSYSLFSWFFYCIRLCHVLSLRSCSFFSCIFLCLVLSCLALVLNSLLLAWPFWYCPIFLFCLILSCLFLFCNIASSVFLCRILFCSALTWLLRLMFCRAVICPILSYDVLYCIASRVLSCFVQSYIILCSVLSWHTCSVLAILFYWTALYPDFKCKVSSLYNFLVLHVLFCLTALCSDCKCRVTSLYNAYLACNWIPESVIVCANQKDQVCQ